MTVIFHSPALLSRKDFLVFHHLFRREINRLLPVSAAVYFWEKEGNWLSEKDAGQMLGKKSGRLPQVCSSLEPSIIEGVLILPIAIADGDNAAVIAGEIDPGLLARMAPEWLEDLREKVQQALVQVKEAYIVPETGLYSRRLLDELWNDFVDREGAFYLIGIPANTRSSTVGLLRIVQSAHLLGTAMNGPVFYFGGNVFGVYQESDSREGSMRFGRRLLGRLKREGMQRVHIGIALVHEQEDKIVENVLDDCWQALETAERRGPFSLCEVSFVRDRQSHPLAPPDEQVVRQLRNKWRGLQRFSLLLVRRENIAEEKPDASLARLVRENVHGDYFSVQINPAECCILLPGVTAKKARQIAGQIKKRFDAGLKGGQVAVGVSCWPCLDNPKKATIVNCRKALMHGDFFGPGSITLFDHVSLNVSGDYYYEEGDYRQAVREYRNGLRLAPDEINLLNSLGVALTDLNRLKEAVDYFNLVLKQEPRNFMALVNKGFALRMLGRNEAALSCLATAAQCREFASSPVAIDISLQLGRLYNDTGQYDKSLRLLEKMKLRNSEKTGYLFYSLLGRAYAARGKNDRAMVMLQKAVRLNPHDAGSMSILGELYCSQGEGDDIALSLCTNAVGIDDQSWENWYRLARVKFMIADYNGALEAVKEALGIHRKSVDAMYLAGKVYAKLGRAKRAESLLQKVLRISPDFRDASRAF